MASYPTASPFRYAGCVMAAQPASRASRSISPARTDTKTTSCPVACPPAAPKKPSTAPAASTSATQPPGCNPRRISGEDHLAGAAGVGRQAAHDLLQQFAVALLGLADGPGVLVHEAEPVGHGVYLRRKRVPHVLFQLLDAALKLLNRGHVGRIARPALNRALPRPTARPAGPFAARRERGGICADGQAHEGDSLG